MKHPLQVDAKDLDEWSDRLPARSELPRIIYRLIHETVGHVDSLSFPCAEDTQLSGWDGRVDVPLGNQYVPAGISRWEVKVSRGTTAEANKDYDKRTTCPADVDPATSAFVFATLRRWPGKEDWLKKKRAEGKWKRVEAYDAGDLAAWLNLAPSTLTWLSVAVGKQPRGARDLEQEWLNWSEVTAPPISIDLVLAGRQETSTTIQAWLAGSGGQLSVQASSHEDAFAIFAASTLRLPAEQCEQVLARTVVVHDRDTWDQVVGVLNPLILVSRLGDPGAVAQARRNGHRVFVPLGATDIAAADTLRAPRLSRLKASDALRKMGLDSNRAWRMSGLARRGLKPFQRLLAVNSGDRKPAWAEGEAALALCSLVLAGAWQDDNEDDRVAVSLLSGMEYPEATRVLRKWSNDPDPPVRLVAGTWVTTSIEDANSLLAPLASTHVMSSFEEVAADVLGTPERRYELPKGERYLAEVMGHGPIYSPSLRKGLADTLALLGSRWDDESGSGGWVDSARRVVRRLLTRANKNWLGWASLSGYLPLLAEAAPDEFLSAAESGLDTSEQNPTLLRLLEEEEDSPLFASSPHTGLLWALETLAWSPQHLSRATLLLGGLARRDPGGRLANRPSASLRGIFLPWHPCTVATADQRLAALDLLRAREPEVSWKLLVSMLPEYRSVGESNAKPVWRDWAADGERGISRAEYIQASSEVVDRMLADAGDVGSRWADLASKVDALPPDLHELVVGKLNGLDLDSLSEVCRAEIWHALRRQVSRHRSFPDADWTLPPDCVDKLAEVLDRFEPDDPFERHGWLFDHRPDLPEGLRRDHRAHDAAIEEARGEAVRSLFVHSGIRGIAEFSEFVPQSRFVGLALGQSDLLDTDEEEEEVLGRYLACDSNAQAVFAAEFGRARTRLKGPDWVRSKLASDAGKSWCPQKRAALLVSLPYERKTFDFVDNLGSEDDAAYWALASPWRIEDSDDKERAVRKLVAAGRPGMACHTLGPSSRTDGAGVPPDLIADALEGLLSGPADAVPDSYDIEELLKVLVEAKGFDRSRIARLEWALLPLGERTPPTVLHQSLVVDPLFFAAVVSWMVGEKEKAPGDARRDEIRSRAYRLLHSWRQIPGTQPDGSIDVADLKQWVAEARRELRASGLLNIGDQMIGQALSGSPIGSEGAWPHEAVREVIEEVQSDDVESGINIGKCDSRGAVRRSAEGGGDDERSLADEYAQHAELMRNGPWPRTAAMLDRMASTYRRYGRDEDGRRDLRGDLD